jgi:hypothetical protein
MVNCVAQAIIEMTHVSSEICAVVGALVENDAVVVVACIVALADLGDVFEKEVALNRCVLNVSTGRDNR